MDVSSCLISEETWDSCTLERVSEDYKNTKHGKRLTEITIRTLCICSILPIYQITKCAFLL